MEKLFEFLGLLEKKISLTSHLYYNQRSAGGAEAVLCLKCGLSGGKRVIASDSLAAELQHGALLECYFAVSRIVKVCCSCRAACTGNLQV